MSVHWPIPNDAKCLEINGYPLAFRDEGVGPSIILIHGSIVDYRTWAPNVAALATRFRVITPSLRHYFPERWDGIGTDFTIEQHAADVAALVKSLAVAPAHVVGWSRGGLVAMEMARQAPELIRTLILEDGTMSLAGEETDAMRAAKVAAENRLSALKSAILAGEQEQGAQQLVDALNGPGAWSRMPEDRRQMMLDNVPTALADVRKPFPREALEAIRMPMLLLTGENSPKSYAQFYDTLRQVCNCGPTVVIPDAAHFMHADNPTAFNAAIMKFASEH